MVELAELIGNFGAMVIIVALFCWDWICNRKDTKNSLAEMAKSNANTAKSLELLQKSMENQERLMRELEKELEKRSAEIITTINDNTK